jgi:CO/xanthine dehydrogenase Mo-binding subunit
MAQTHAQQTESCIARPVGQVVKVSKDADGKIKIDHVWAVMDCGWYVNPDIVKRRRWKEPS